MLRRQNWNAQNRGRGGRSAQFEILYCRVGASNDLKASYAVAMLGHTSMQVEGESISRASSYRILFWVQKGPGWELASINGLFDIQFEQMSILQFLKFCLRDKNHIWKPGKIMRIKDQVKDPSSANEKRICLLAAFWPQLWLSIKLIRAHPWVAIKGKTTQSSDW